VISKQNWAQQTVRSWVLAFNNTNILQGFLSSGRWKKALRFLGLP